MSIEQAKPAWKDVPVYMHTGEYARMHNELELYRESFNASMACKKAIEEAIAKDFDGFYLAKDCELPVIDKFGFERVVYVLAVTLCEKSHDERFSMSNRNWAKEYISRNGSESAPEINTRNVYIVVNSHSTVLDGFVNRVRKCMECGQSS